MKEHKCHLCNGLPIIKAGLQEDETYLIEVKCVLCGKEWVQKSCRFYGSSEGILVRTIQEIQRTVNDWNIRQEWKKEALDMSTRLDKLKRILDRIQELNGSPVTEENKKRAAILDYDIIGFADELEASGFETASMAAKDLRKAWESSKFHGYCLKGYE